VYHTTACPAVAPKRARRMSFQLALLASASLSGLAELRPLALSRENKGVSWSLNRMYTEMATRTIDRRNGIRQPQAANVAAPSVPSVTRITAIETNRPMVAVV